MNSKKPYEWTMRLVTPLLSHGVRRAEVRVTQIKSNIRYCWRIACHPHNDLLLEDEKKLFGSNDKPSPYIFRLGDESLTCSQNIVDHIEGFEAYDRNKGFFNVLVRFKGSIQEERFMELMALSIVLGGVGQKVKKGYGALWSEELIKKIKPNYKELIPIQLIADLLEKHSSREFQVDNKENTILFQHNKDKKGNKIDSNYVEKIMIGKLCPRDEFLQKVKSAMKRADKKYPYKAYTLGCLHKTTPSPLLITCIPNYGVGDLGDQYQKVYPIITILNHSPSRFRFKKVSNDAKKKLLANYSDYLEILREGILK